MKQTTVLHEFWNRFRLSESQVEKLALLSEMAAIVWERASAVSRHKRRATFERVIRPAKALCGKRCAVCSQPAQVRHHIIQIQHGGRNKRGNLMELCNVCHAVVHPWLQESKA